MSAPNNKIYSIPAGLSPPVFWKTHSENSDPRTAKYSPMPTTLSRFHIPDTDSVHLSQNPMDQKYLPKVILFLNPMAELRVHPDNPG